MEWLNIAIAVITLVGVIITLVRYGGKFETRNAVFHEQLKVLDARTEKIETNHLPHLQEKVDLIRESQIRMEEFIKNLKK